MREIGISPRFSRDKFVPLQTKQRYSTRDISGKVFLTLFFRGFVPFLSLADFVSRNKNLQVVDLQRLKSCFEELVTATTSNHQKGYFKLMFTDECYCDYQRFFFLTDGMKRAPLSENDTMELHNILAQGKFLNTIEESLFDYFKQQAESFTVSLLSEQIHTFYKNGRNSATIRICNILFAIDPLSDIAMTYAVCTYRRQNRSDKAIHLYSIFTKEYRKVMDEDYPIAFDKVNTENIRF